MFPLALVFLAAALAAAQPSGDPQALFDRAVADFHAGRIAQSVQGFDRVAALVPRHAPQLWQRGIALYYAGRYKDCRAQFESHRTVNPNDVENAAWHFLCVARAESPEKARAALLPVGPDARVPMREVYRMFRGELSPEGVLAAAGSRLESQFFARLYLGLYFDAAGDTSRALENIRVAAEDRYAVGGYMHGVARVHLAQLTAPEIWTFDRLDKIGGHSTRTFGEPRVINTAEGKAVEFDGIDDGLIVGVHPLAGAKTFTWEVVFRPYSGGPAEQRFFHMQEQDTQSRLLLETRIIGGKWCLDSYAQSATGSKTLIDRTKLHTLDQWHHVAMVYDGREFRHYVDGELQGASDVALLPQGEGQTSIGMRINRVFYFKGAIRLARMTRRALAPEEFLKANKSPAD
jgi:hypothetical protein